MTGTELKRVYGSSMTVKEKQIIVINRLTALVNEEFDAAGRKRSQTAAQPQKETCACTEIGCCAEFINLQ